MGSATSRHTIVIKNWDSLKKGSFAIQNICATTASDPHSSGGKSIVTFYSNLNGEVDLNGRITLMFQAGESKKSGGFVELFYLKDGESCSKKFYVPLQMGVPESDITYVSL